jgi:hypothetical protein
MSFTLAYGQAENRIEGNENNLDVVCRTALDKIRINRPHPGNGDFIWGGVKLGWLDREAAKAAGL